MGGDETIINGIESVFTGEGTLLMPTLSRKNFSNFYNTWYMDKSSDVGYLTEYFRKQMCVYRSNDETHSVAARGLAKKTLCGDATLICVDTKEASDTAYNILLAEPEKCYKDTKLEWIKDCIAAAEN